MRRSVDERYANFECRLYDGSQISKHSLFIWEVVKVHIATSPNYPETVHYRGEGVFMISDRNISRRSQFRAQNM
jgi:flavin reductase (DIM6/NTAB) family NADH-FMN oxidoreductase RutF